MSERRQVAPEEGDPGIVRRAMVPPPGRGTSSTAPPCREATSLTMERPRPLPGRARAVGERQKRSKTRSASAGSRPGPRSETSSTPPRRPDLDGRPGRRELDRVVEEVDHGSLECRRVAGDDPRLQRDVEPVARGPAAGPLDCVLHRLVEPDLLEAGRRLVREGELGEVVHQARQLGDLARSGRSSGVPRHPRAVGDPDFAPVAAARRWRAGSSTGCVARARRPRRVVADAAAHRRARRSSC